MKRIIVAIVVLSFMAGCQGTQRYGGGLHSKEGDHRSKPNGKGSTTRTVESMAVNYRVDPIAFGEIIDRYLGRPYAGKSNSQKGYDCSEFVGAAYYEYASVHVPRTTEKLFSAGRKVRPGDLYFGDLVFFDTGGKGVSHVGIYIGFGEFVHSTLSEGIVISSLSDKYYKKRYLGARRVLE